MFPFFIGKFLLFCMYCIYAYMDACMCLQLISQCIKNYVSNYFLFYIIRKHNLILIFLITFNYITVQFLTATVIIPATILN